MERSKTGTKKKKLRRPIITKSKYNNNTHNIVIFHKKWKKGQRNSINKKTNGHEQSKNEKSSTLRLFAFTTLISTYRGQMRLSQSDTDETDTCKRIYNIQ